VAQVVGAVAGTALANLMFGLPALHLSGHERSGAGLWLGEVVATTGLVLTIGLLRDGARADLVVPAWIFGAYFLTSSTSFANPAVTVARAFSDTFSGIAPSSVPAFVVAQLVGGAVAVGLLRILYLPPADIATAKEAPHEREALRPVRLRPQRGALADGRGIPRAPRGRRRGGALRREPTGR
jgi:arsenate reductase